MTIDPVTARDSLRADCSSCVGLCCVAMPLTRSADFAIDKPAGMPCLHLTGSDRCEIHAELRPRGFPGCSAFDCFGAGQQVTQVTFGGAGWRDSEGEAQRMFRAFAVLRAVHEMRWYLADAGARVTGAAFRDEIEANAERLERLSSASPAALDAVDVDALRAEVGDLLSRLSSAVRSEGDATRPGRDLAGQDLAGRDLRGANLRRALLRGALLIGANLQQADLREADLLGTDLRGADLRGADLTDALFLTQPQVAAAVGNPATRIPESLRSPRHWT